MKLTKSLAIGAIAIALCGCSMEADDSGRVNLTFRQSAEEQFRWAGRVAPGRVVEVKGINGAVRAEAAIGDQVEVVAMKTGRRQDPASVRIEVVEHAGGVTVCAVYPDDFSREPNRCAPGDAGHLNSRNSDVRVDFTVRVPSGVDFVGRTVNGEIAADSLQGRVSVRTVNGSARFSTTGYGDASTVNGSINATMGRTDWSDALEFKTVNGSITVAFGEQPSTEVTAKTLNGDIMSEFPLTVQGTISRRSLHGTIGGGGRQLELSSVNGSIKLRRSM